jgi:hypothetical protein
MCFIVDHRLGIDIHRHFYFCRINTLGLCLLY